MRWSRDVGTIDSDGRNNGDPIDNSGKIECWHGIPWNAIVSL
jgi:hypothetical protein